jgi:integrase
MTKQKTWDEASLRWLRSREEAKWYEKDQGYIARLNDHLLGVPLADIDTAKVCEIRDALLAERAAGTVNRIMGVLRTVLRYAAEAGMTAGVPVIKRLKEKERLRFLTPDEAARLIEAMPDKMKPIVRLALATGLRQFNILNLEWAEVALDRKWLAIPAEKMKNGEAFGAPLNASAVMVLVEQRGKHTRWVFPSTRKAESGPLKGVNNGMWKRACAKAGIADFHFHDLRHTWASWHVQNGTHPRALQELGGWKDDAMVKRYTHLGSEHLHVAAGKIDEALCNISNQPTSRRRSKSARGKRAE